MNETLMEMDEPSGPEKSAKEPEYSEIIDVPVEAGSGPSYESLFEYPSLFSSKTLLELCNSSWSRSANAKQEVQPYVRGCKWSPDGTCCLTVVNGDGVHLTELPRDLYTGTVSSDRTIDVLDSTVHVKEAGLVYDFCWYPGMNSCIPESCCWITTRQNAPVQMWDAFDGSLRCSYRGFNAVDEMEPALSLTFNSEGTRIIAGYKKMLRTFDVDRRRKTEVFGSLYILSLCPAVGVYWLIQKKNMNLTYKIPYKRVLHNTWTHKALVLCAYWRHVLVNDACGANPFLEDHKPGRDFAEHKINSPASCFATDRNLLAMGSWNTTITLYNMNELGTYKSIGKMHGHSGGVTHVKFTPDGLKLVSGSRKDHRLLVWDIRYYRRPLNILTRTVKTNQRIYFDVSLCGKYLITGGTDGVVKVWNVDVVNWKESIDMVDVDKDNSTFRFPLHRDCCNSVSVHPLRPILATGSGQYHFNDPILILEDSFEKENEESGITQNDKDDVTLNGDMKYSSNAENSLVFWWIGEITDMT